MWWDGHRLHSTSWSEFGIAMAVMLLAVPAAPIWLPIVLVRAWLRSSREMREWREAHPRPWMGEGQSPRD
jgi:hypothetical protein